MDRNLHKIHETYAWTWKMLTWRIHMAISVGPTYVQEHQTTSTSRSMYGEIWGEHTVWLLSKKKAKTKMALIQRNQSSTMPDNWAGTFIFNLNFKVKKNSQCSQWDGARRKLDSSAVKWSWSSEIPDLRAIARTFRKYNQSLCLRRKTIEVNSEPWLRHPGGVPVLRHRQTKADVLYCCAIRWIIKMAQEKRVYRDFCHKSRISATTKTLVRRTLSG